VNGSQRVAVFFYVNDSFQEELSFRLNEVKGKLCVRRTKAAFLSWCKSSPVKALAGRPVASVAIRRATGGCEAYTVHSE